MTDKLRMDAYYYGFEPTGCPEIGLILSAVASAGKMYHHTDNWSDEEGWLESEVFEGDSCTKWIQNAANSAAAALNISVPTPMTDELEGAPTNKKMSDADAKAQEQEAIDLKLLIAKVRNEALEEAAKATTDPYWFDEEPPLYQDGFRGGRLHAAGSIRALKSPTT